jgi:outer membrane lipoprotein-sorting protein
MPASAKSWLAARTRAAIETLAAAWRDSVDWAAKSPQAAARGTATTEKRKMPLKAAFAAILICALMPAQPSALAQAVPLPVPAPQPKIKPPATGTLPPPASLAQSAAPAQKPPTPVPPNSRAIPRNGKPAPLDAGQRALVEKVNAYLSRIQTLVGNFVQVGPDGSRSTGDFYIQKPGKVRFEYNPPVPIEIIADGTSIAVRDSKLSTQDTYFLSQTPLRHLLSDKIDLLKDTNLIAVHADEMFVTLVIEEKHAIAGTHRLMLMFGAKDLQLRQWTVTDPQGYDTTVAVYNLDSNKKPDPSMFRIEYQRLIQ